jgi:septal ring factor EnvC (AmiA/AmiB activator)
MQKLLAIVAVVALLAGGAFWWFTQNQAPMEEDVVVAKPVAPAAPATPPEPVAPAEPAAPAASDAVALKEEELDKVKAEAAEMAARAADLEEQVKDGQMIVDLKAKQIEKLEAELKALQKAERSTQKK